MSSNFSIYFNGSTSQSITSRRRNYGDGSFLIRIVELFFFFQFQRFFFGSQVLPKRSMADDRLVRSLGGLGMVAAIFLVQVSWQNTLFFTAQGSHVPMGRNPRHACLPSLGLVRVVECCCCVRLLLA